MNAPAESSTAAHPVLWVILAGLVIWGAQSYDSDLRKDNVLYASIAKQVLAGGNPLQLQWGDEPYLNKPPLFFWVTALSMKVLGPTVFAAKLPTILFGVGCLLLLFRLARRVSGSTELALLAVFVAVLTYPLNRTTNACRMESMVVLLMLLSLEAWLGYRASGRLRHLLLLGGALGLALLTKGPQALVVAAALLGFVLFLDRPWTARRLGALVCALFLAAVIGGSWYVYMLQHSPAFAANFHEQVIDRVGPSGGATYEAGSPFYYVENVLTEYLVFVPFLIIGLKRGGRVLRRSPEARLYALFGILYLLGIHLLATKYMRYMYSVYMLAAIPVAAGLPRWLRERSLRALQILTVTAAVAVTVIPIPYLHTHQYARLSELNEMAAHSGLPMVVTPGFYENWESRSAALFFLDEFVRAAPAGPHFQLYPSPPPVPPGALVLTTKLVAVYAVVP